MITDLNRTVAYRCPVCGEISFASVSLFELCSNMGVAMRCRCGQSRMIISTANRKLFNLSVECVLCGEEHSFHFTFRDIARRRSRKFLCPHSTFEVGIAYVGRIEGVAPQIEVDESYISELADEFNLSAMGKNTLFYLRAIDKVRTLADEGAISCECGSELIGMDAGSDGLTLVCETCGATKRLPLEMIRSKKFTELDHIVLDEPPEEE